MFGSRGLYMFEFRPKFEQRACHYEDQIFSHLEIKQSSIFHALLPSVYNNVNGNKPLMGRLTGAMARVIQG